MQNNIKQYFEQQVQPIFEDLITKITMNRPEDILQYALQYFKDPQKDQNNSDDDNFLHQQIDATVFNKIRQEKLKSNVRKRRIAVSSQANNLINPTRKTISLRKNGIKNQRTQIMLRFYFSNTFLFRYFDQEEINLLIDGMVQERTECNQVVIKQGQYGECMYFIQQGFFQCSLKGDQQEQDKRTVRFLKNYQAGDTFGDICLLHRAKRQATVISKTEGVLYSLSRQTYTSLYKMSVGKRRSSYIQKLMNVSIFSVLVPEQFQKICDLLKEVRFQAGNYIIHEGDRGNTFFIVIEGILVAKSNSQQAFYQYYKEGDYFGQLALINNKPRQLSVQAVTKCRLVSLSSDIFFSMVNYDKANVEIKNKYKDAKPLTNIRKKKNTNNDL